MATFAFHVNASGLLYHSVIVIDIVETANVLQPFMKLIRAYRLGYKFLPATAVDKDAIGKIKKDIFISQAHQLLIKMLPNHERKSKEKDSLPLIFFEKLFNTLYIQFHVIV